MKRITLCLTIAIIYSMSSEAQDISTSSLKWNSNRTFEANTGTSTDEVTVFTTSGGQLQWKNSDGSTRLSFQVIESIGTWTDVSSDGHVQYEVTDSDYSGTISIRRLNGQVNILIVLASEPSKMFELNIGSVENLC